MKKIIIPSDCNYIASFLTMRCNLNCSFCLNAFSRSFERGRFEEASGDTWISSLNRIESVPQVPITLSGGEPSLHPNFIEFVNGIKQETNIDILTNLMWSKKTLQRFVNEIDPARLKRDSPYASIRASYHPEQMGNGEKLVENARELIENGFSVGIWAVLYPSPQQLSAINQMQFRCKDAGIEFRVKEFMGEYKDEIYGDYSLYPGSAFEKTNSICECKTSELLIGTDCKVYKCHRDLYTEEFSYGDLSNPEWEFEMNYKECSKYGQCHPCDVKVKTNYKQELGHTSVEIRNVIRK